MGKKNKSRKARRTGTPVGEEEVSSDYEVVEEIYEVECVVDHRTRRGGTEYKVRWRGWSPQFDEWLHYSKMDCPEAIREYWERVEKAKESQGSAKKRDHSDAHRARSSSFRKRTSSPEAKRRQTSSPGAKRQRTSSPDDKRRQTSSPDPKRRLVEDNDTEGSSLHAHVESGSVSPTISECLGRASPKDCVTEETSKGVVPSAGKKKATSKRSNVEPMEQLSTDRQEEVKVASQPPVDIPSASSHEQMQASNVLERSSETAADGPSSSSQTQASDVSARSSPFPPPQAPARRSIPPPPAIPKRKRVQSMSSAASSPTNITESSGIRVPSSCDVGERKTASPSVSSETKEEVKQGSETCDIQEKSVKKVEQTPKEPFVRPHGFERGLTVERIHGFIRRADLLFAVVQFKNCDVVEILATHIVKHYEPMALIRGFEEHHIRSRRNAILSSPHPSSKRSC